MLFRALRTRLKQRRCDHRTLTPISIREIEPRGVSLGWTGRPELVRRWEKTCDKCGATVITEGYVWRDNIKRDARGWPLQNDGTPYPMTSYL